MKHVICLFGNYGAGKTFLARENTNNVVAFASPIRTIAFKLLHNDIFYSTKQEDKDKPLDIPKVLTKPRGVSQAMMDGINRYIDEFPHTVRGVLQAIGSSGREIDKGYWSKKTHEVVEKILSTNEEVVFIDDLRYMQEFKELKKLEKHPIQKIKVIKVHVSNLKPLEGYELDKLVKDCAISIINLKTPRVEVFDTGKDMKIECYCNDILKVLKFLTES